MKSTNTQTLIFFLLLFTPFKSLASDSLKVKKIEYFEEEKLVRATFLNKNEKKTRQFFYDYSENINGQLENKVYIFEFKEGKHHCITEYYFKIHENDVIFQNVPFLGSYQCVEFDTTNKPILATGITILLNAGYSKRICSLDSIDFLPVTKEKGFVLKYKYDLLGNIIEKKYIDKVNIGNKILNQYDSLKRQTGYTFINRPKKKVGKMTYLKNIIETIEEDFEGRKLILKSIEKSFLDEKKQELKKEKYTISLKNSKPIGEPKLTFTTENIYENGKIVKIIYTDHVLGKTKTHELKYEFY